jgi:hypothetical protein
MPSYTLVPNVNWNNSSLFTITGGSASVAAALSDANDATSVQKTTNGQLLALDLELGTTTIPANEKISSVTVQARFSQGAQGNLGAAIGYVTNRNSKIAKFSNASYISGAQTLPGAGVWTDFGLNLTKGPDGNAWDQSRVDDMLVRLNDYSTGAGAVIRDIRVIVTTTTQPTVTVTSPTGTVTDTTLPAINWTFADTEGDNQVAYQVKIYTAAQYGAGGFSPDTSTATLDTGIVSSGDQGAALTVDLANSTTYRAYVRAAQNLNGSNYFSTWSYSQFTLGLSAPNTPVVSSQYNSATAAVVITIIGQTNLLSDNAASIETDATGWTASLNCAIARSTAQFAAGAASLSLTASSASDMTATTANSYAVTANQSHSAIAQFRAATSARSIKLGIQWLTSANAVISTVYGTTVNNATTGWTTASVTGAAPANAAYGKVVAYVTSPASTEVHYIDQIALHPGSTPTFTLGGYSGFTFSVDRSADNGVTWSAVRNSPVTASAAQTATLTDYEAPLSSTVLYRAKATGNR